MRKILLTCFLILGLGIKAQILVNESFEGTALPSGWTSFSNATLTTTLSTSYGTSAGTPCAGTKGIYKNLYSTVSAWYLVYSSTASNATALNYSLKYLAKGFGTTGAISGSVGVDYSVDGGTTWTDLLATTTLSSPNATPIPCTTVSGTIPAGTIPTGASFKLRIKSLYTSPGDYYMGFDDVQLSQTLTNPPACTTVSAPANAATGVSVTPSITYAASSGTSSYLINLGTTSGGTDVLNAYNNAANLTYAIPTASALLYNTTYYLKVVPTNAIGSATGCTETTFTTLNVPCPTVTAPAAAATGTTLKPTITWSALTGVTGYRLSVGTTSGGTDIVNNQDLGNVLSYTFPTNLNTSTTYYYTVTAYQGANSSSACTVRSFTTGTIAPPANDDCANAVALTVNPDLACGTVTAGNTKGATLSMAASPCFGTPDDDVWYSFVATNSTHFVSLANVVSTGTLSTTDAYFQVLSGSCGSLTSVLCSDPNSATVSGLTVGQTYYIRVYTYSNGSTYNISFNLCVGTPPPPPANDDCVNAVALTVNPDLNCGSVAAGNTLSATQSMAATPCFGTPDDDVWYSFVATNTSHVVSLSNVVSTGSLSSTDAYFQVLSGSCGSLTSVLCSDPNSATVSGLTVGQTYYIRVYSYSSGNYNISFNICVGTLPPPPTNDDCATAVALTVNADLACGSTTNGSTYLATDSAIAVAPCTGTADDDVWYTFTATGDSHIITLSNVISTGTTSSTSLYTQVFSGACGALTSIKCGTTTTTTVTGLTAGQTYYVRVYNSNGAGYSNSFTICVGTPPPPPANDNCSGAIAITPGATFAQNPMTATNVSATTTTDTSAVHACQTIGSNEVWYSVVVPASGSITIETDAVTGSTVTDTVMGVYSGVCGSLVSVGCDDDTGNGNFSKVALTGQTPGATLLVGVWNYSSTTAGQFQISAYDATLGTANAISSIKEVTLYPNPFKDVVMISDIKNIKTISVVDLSGRLIKTLKPSRELQLGDLKTGLYLINLNYEDGTTKTIKAIKK